MNLKKTLKTLKLNENMISAILGVLVIIVVGVIAINYFSSQKEGETIPPVEVEEKTSNLNLPAKHTVKAGENLWGISLQYYGSGYNWVDIANANQLKSPNDIAEGQELSIPDVQPKVFGEALSPTSQPLAIASPVPTATTAPKTETEAVGSNYTVAEGDNLWRIAEKHYNSGYNWVDIASANKLTNPNLIETGQKLVIPDVSPKDLTASDSNSETGESIAGATYTVQQGDSLWLIALRAYGDGYKWAEISNDNNLTEPGVIHPGNVLRLKR